MEIRRIEGIIPVEGLNRDLPLKLENFSYYDMKKLLSTVTSGSSKKDVSEELESLLIKATFLGYTPEGKAKLKSGKLILIADVKVDREFREGEELLLKLENTSPKIELSVVKTEQKPRKLLETLREFLPKQQPELTELSKFLNKEVLSYLQKIATKRFPELKENLPAFLPSKTAVPSPFHLLALLMLLEESTFQKVRDKLPPGTRKDEINKAVEELIATYALFVITGIVLSPVYLNGELKGRAYFKKEEDMAAALVELELSEGKLLLLVKLLGKNLSVELFTESRKLKESLNTEDLKKFLADKGFNPVVVRFSEKKEFEEEKEKFLKGSEKGFTVDFSA